MTLQSRQQYWEMGFLTSNLENICPIHVGMFDIWVGESWFELISHQYVEHGFLAKMLKLVLTVCSLVAEMQYSTNVSVCIWYTKTLSGQGKTIEIRTFSSLWKYSLN